jgi:hypothetical protein
MYPDVIVRDSDKQFRLRIHGYLRSIGVSQIIGTKEFLEIEFIGGECSIIVPYPQKLEDLNEAIKRKLLDETQRSLIEIDNIRLYVNDHVEEIKEGRRSLIQ